MPGPRLPPLGDLRAPPEDVARWLFWVALRRAVDPSRPGSLRRLWPAWVVRHGAGGAQKVRMADEFRRIRGPDPVGIRRLVAEAYRVAWRVHLEELLLGRLEAGTVDLHLEVRGRERLDAALARGRGVVLLSAHAGSFMLPIAWLSLRGYAYTQYAARGLPPEEVVRAHPDVLPVNWWQAQVRRVREEHEDRLPASFLTASTPVRELYRRLAHNEIVALAFDGRIGTRWVRTPLLGREALLSPGGYRLAEATGAALVPLFCRTPPDRPSIAEVGEPLVPGGQGWRTLMQTFVSERADPFLRRHPEEYGTWLAHCRLRASIDDHPLFVDCATDDRWRRHEAL
jgi:phosphatidylinositol dimannoside acyltransferase